MFLAMARLHRNSYGQRDGKDTKKQVGSSGRCHFHSFRIKEVALSPHDKQC
jgi:hypothetical protein